MPGGNRHTPERHHTRQLRRDERGTGGETRELRSSQYAFLFLYRLVITCDTLRHGQRRERAGSRAYLANLRSYSTTRDWFSALWYSQFHTTGHTTGDRAQARREGANKRHVEIAQPAVFAPHNFASMIAYIVYNQESCNAPRPLYSLRLQYAYASAGSARALDGQREHAHHIAPDLFARWTFSELTLPMHTASPYSHSHRRSPRRSWPEMSRRTSPRTHPCRGRR